MIDLPVDKGKPVLRRLRVILKILALDDKIIFLTPGLGLVSQKM